MRAGMAMAVRMVVVMLVVMVIVQRVTVIVVVHQFLRDIRKQLARGRRLTAGPLDASLGRRRRLGPHRGDLAVGTLDARRFGHGGLRFVARSLP